MNVIRKRKRIDQRLRFAPGYIRHGVQVKHVKRHQNITDTVVHMNVAADRRNRFNV